MAPRRPSSTAQGTLEMSQAEDDAKAAALTRLGYRGDRHPVGSGHLRHLPGTPAYGVLKVGDVVTAVDGVTTPHGPTLTATLTHYHSGQTVDLTVRRQGDRPARPGADHAEYDRGRPRRRPDRSRLDLGIQPEDQVDFTYPFPVKIDVTNIGGPSAGLAMTLGVIDALTSGSVTGGHTVAATGTIDSPGRRGGRRWRAPRRPWRWRTPGPRSSWSRPRSTRPRMSKDRPGLQVYAVSTLDQALTGAGRPRGEGAAGPVADQPDGLPGRHRRMTDLGNARS